MGFAIGPRELLGVGARANGVGFAGNFGEALEGRPLRPGARKCR
jgi:hypothetical protein